MAGATALLATRPWDASRYRKTLDTLGERFDVRVGPAHLSGAGFDGDGDRPPDLTESRSPL